MREVVAEQGKWQGILVGLGGAIILDAGKELFILDLVPSEMEIAAALVNTGKAVEILGCLTYFSNYYLPLIKVDKIDLFVPFGFNLAPAQPSSETAPEHSCQTKEDPTKPQTNQQ